MKTKFCAFVLLLTLGGGAHAATLSDTAQAAVLSKKIIAAYAAEDYAKTQKLFMEYDQLDAAMPPPLMLVRVRFYYHISEFAAAHQLLGDYLNTTSPDSPDYDTALEMYVALDERKEAERIKEEKRKETERIKEEKKLKKFLSAYGVTDINATNSQGKTALEQAVASGDRQGVKTLINAGADINAKNSQGKTALDQAIESGDKQAISILADAGVRVDLEAMLQSAAESNDVNKMRQLVRVGANINAKDDNGWTTLHTAAVMNSAAIAKYLLDAGMKVNVPLKDDGEPFTDELKKKLRTITGTSYDRWTRDGEVPLYLAARENAFGVAALLIEKGADINAKNNYGYAPLHNAAWRNGVEVAALLIEKGADINAKDSSGATPLHDAAWQNAVGVAALLIEKGADINAKDNYGRTPLKIAKDYNKAEVVALLRKAGAKTNTTSTTRTSQKSSQQGDK